MIIVNNIQNTIFKNIQLEIIFLLFTCKYTFYLYDVNLYCKKDIYFTFKNMNGKMYGNLHSPDIFIELISPVVLSKTLPY